MFSRVLIEVRWSDENVWKPLRWCDPRHDPDEQLNRARSNWARCRAQYRFMCEAEFRPITVYYGEETCR